LSGVARSNVFGACGSGRSGGSAGWVTAIRAVIAELSAFGCRPVRAIFEAEAPPSAYHKLVCRKVHSLLFDRRAGVAARRHDGCILVVSGIRRS
jgi:hypothetical protein